MKIVIFDNCLVSLSKISSLSDFFLLSSLSCQAGVGCDFLARVWEYGNIGEEEAPSLSALWVLLGSAMDFLSWALLCGTRVSLGVLASETTVPQLDLLPGVDQDPAALLPDLAFPWPLFYRDLGISAPGCWLTCIPENIWHRSPSFALRWACDSHENSLQPLPAPLRCLWGLEEPFSASGTWEQPRKAGPDPPS